jgi:hypothetical protein
MRLAALFAVALLPLAACSDSESTTPGTTSGGNSVTQPIGPEGGTIVVGGATVTIPKGALADTKQITISATDEKPPAGFTAVSKVFRCEPSGTEFAADVTMEMPFTDDGKPVKMFWSTGSDPTFKDIGGSSANGKTMIATVKHFSAGFVGRQP